MVTHLAMMLIAEGHSMDFLIKILIMPTNSQMLKVTRAFRYASALEVQNLHSFVKPQSKKSFLTNIKTRSDNLAYTLNSLMFYSLDFDSYHSYQDAFIKTNKSQS